MINKLIILLLIIALLYGLYKYHRGFIDDVFVEIENIAPLPSKKEEVKEVKKVTFDDASVGSLFILDELNKKNGESGGDSEFSDGTVDKV